jgi:phosphoribosylglycinamide formyltransferase-1
MKDLLRVAVLFSGRGSNLESILKYEKTVNSFKVVAGVTDNINAYGIKHCDSYRINTIVLNNLNHGKTFWENQLTYMLKSYKIDLVVLAGFMKILSPNWCKNWENKCINIHPSLLPSYKGLHTHKRVLLNKDKIHGCTVHYIVPQVDEGPIIAQEKVKVLEKDTEQSLALRVLKKENILLPKVIDNIAKGVILCHGNKVFYKTNELKNPLKISNL